MGQTVHLQKEIALITFRYRRVKKNKQKIFHSPSKWRPTFDMASKNRPGSRRLTKEENRNVNSRFV